LLATRRTTLTRTDHQPDLPAILTLRLDVEVIEPGFFPFLLSRISGEPERSRTASARPT